MVINRKINDRKKKKSLVFHSGFATSKILIEIEVKLATL